MRSKKALAVLFSSVIAAVALPGATFAQQQLPADGRLLDASNRIGSNGINEGGYVRPAPVTGQDIVSGNVTAGKEFHWGVSTQGRGVDTRTPSYTDPTAFRGQTGMYQTDRFIQKSSGGSDARLNALTGNIATPSYGEYRAAPPPTGYVQNPETGAYVPAPPQPRSPEDTRLGLPTNVPGTNLPKPGELLMPGPVDPTSNQPTVFTGSPLYGIRQWKLGDAGDAYFLTNYTNLGRPGANSRLQVDEAAVTQMRTELNQSVDAATDPNAPKNLAETNAVPSAELASSAVTDKPFNSQINQSSLGAGVNTDQSTRNTIVAVAPAQQSTQYAELRKRMDAFQAEKKQTDEEAYRQFQAQMKARQDAEAKNQDATGMAALNNVDATTQPAGEGVERFGMTDYAKESRDVMESALGNDQAKVAELAAAGAFPEGVRPSEKIKRPEPLKIASLADGVKAKGLHDLLKTAEDQMKMGKFAAALDQYDIAEQVAPNNGMITLGRAHAELGASYYGRAEADLRKAFGADPALLLAQYDLRSMLGEDRLQFLVKDLKEIASSEKQSVRPVLLLAYIAYNSGNERRAQTFLTAADKRSDGRDPLIKQMLQNWYFPGGEDTEASEPLP